MKKIISVLIMAIAIMSCSSDSEGIDIATYNGPLKINNHLFEMGSSPQNATTRYYPDNQSRNISFSNGRIVTDAFDGFAINIPVGSETTDISGEYVLNSGGGLEAWYQFGNFYARKMLSGTMKIHDAGDGFYRVEFRNVHIEANESIPTDHKIAGYFETTFVAAE
ncbi:hypothetical protein [Flavobacterium selenitireducens]|uniref:hypothetical protein n=1 Tax=Flavobacterium selenitireducens TaxID=2722704 RepID=UPI00168A429A|nr:hypothetical protein [Flavobacterium selenitireducens]MBD3580964.1 hypothetical protein [Flavobacterium selenitireducens]